MPSDPNRRPTRPEPTESSQPHPYHVETPHVPDNQSLTARLGRRLFGWITRLMGG